jgi:hypothetical protein
MCIQLAIIHRSITTVANCHNIDPNSYFGPFKFSRFFIHQNMTRTEEPDTSAAIADVSKPLCYATEPEQDDADRHRIAIIQMGQGPRNNARSLHFNGCDIIFVKYVRHDYKARSWMPLRTTRRCP